MRWQAYSDHCHSLALFDDEAYLGWSRSLFSWLVSANLEISGSLCHVSIHFIISVFSDASWLSCFQLFWLVISCGLEGLGILIGLGLDCLGPHVWNVVIIDRSAYVLRIYAVVLTFAELQAKSPQAHAQSQSRHVHFLGMGDKWKKSCQAWGDIRENWLTDKCVIFTTLRDWPSSLRQQCKVISFMLSYNKFMTVSTKKLKIHIESANNMPVVCFKIMK